jgi:hypothetical protein
MESLEFALVEELDSLAHTSPRDYGRRSGLILIFLLI